MGSVSLKIGDDTARFHCATLYSSALQLLMLASAVSTNLFVLYAFSFLPSPSATADVDDHKNLSVISEHVSLILRKIEASECRLYHIEHELVGYETLDPAKLGLPLELKLVLTRHPLPLGHDSRSGITTMVSSVAHSCARPAAVALLSTFMSYSYVASCPTAYPLLLSKLISKACEPPPPLPPSASPFLDLSGTPTPRTPFHLVGWHSPGPFGPCRASIRAVPCLARSGCASPGPGRVVPGLVHGPDFLSLAWPLLMGRAWHGSVL